MDLPRAWEAEAHNWLRWARTPDHDSYWYYRDAFFDRVVPPAGELTVELGCGEGRVTRDLRARDHHVVALDMSPTLLTHARAVDDVSVYVLGDASASPLRDASADLVVAYNSLMDVDDMPATVREAARVLVPDGRLCVCVTHPLNDAGAFAGDGANAPFTITGAYFGARRLESTFVRDGLTMTFRGWGYQLQHYVDAVLDAGLVLELLREPMPARAFPGYERWSRIPMFLHLRARKPGPVSARSSEER